MVKRYCYKKVYKIQPYLIILPNIQKKSSKSIDPFRTKMVHHKGAKLFFKDWSLRRSSYEKISHVDTHVECRSRSGSK